jgi:predicted component of type VI protein secretion system
MQDFVVTVTLPGTQEHFNRTCAGSTTVGRADDCGIQLAHPLVSRRHVEIVPQEDGRFVVRDLSSRNGTTVNGQTLRDGEAVVASGANLQVGPYVLTIAASSGADSDTVLVSIRPAATRVTLDRGLRAVLVDGKPVIERPSVLEYRLLDALDAAAPNLVDNRALGDAVWEEGQWDSYMLHNLIRRVRRKLEEQVGDADELIATVPGVGYRLV